MKDCLTEANVSLQGGVVCLLAAAELPGVLTGMLQSPQQPVGRLAAGSAVRAAAAKAAAPGSKGVGRSSSSRSSGASDPDQEGCQDEGLCPAQQGESNASLAEG